MFPPLSPLTLSLWLRKRPACWCTTQLSGHLVQSLIRERTHTLRLKQPFSTWCNKKLSSRRGLSTVDKTFLSLSLPPMQKIEKTPETHCITAHTTENLATITCNKSTGTNLITCLFMSVTKRLPGLPGYLSISTQ